MSSPGLPTSAWLLAIGATAILLIGAFARFDPTSVPKTASAIAPATAAVAEQDEPADAAGEPALPADLSPGLAEIIRLAQAHVDEGVILSFIENSGQAYSPSADEILYLSDLGLSQNVIAALFKGKPPEAPPTSQEVAAAPPTLPPLEPSASPAPASDSSLFYKDLAPYGAWVQVPDYGLSWQPTVETINPDWRPYLDRGQWLDSDAGWYWQSDYSWGWAVFHYGRWVKEHRLGWVWVPDKVWAPAWVAWRSTGSYFGWAPLLPGVSLNGLGQLTLYGRPLGARFAFPPSSFAFVSADNFLARNLPRHVVPAPRAATLFAGSVIVGNYSVINHKIINGGISRDAVAAAAQKALQPVSLRPVSSPPAAIGPANGATLAVYRRDLSAATPSTASESSPFLINKPRVQPPEPRPAPREDPALPAEALAVESSLVPAPLPSGEPVVQLPPLRYAAPPPAHIKRISYAVGTEEASAPRPVPHHGPGHLDPVERPVTAPPRMEQPTAAARASGPADELRRAAKEPRAAPAVEPRRAVAEARPAPPEPRPALPEPVRAAAPPAGASSKSTK
jgi:hypothetical protein